MTDQTGIYFSVGFCGKERLRKSGKEDVTFWGDKVKSAHINGIYGGIRVYTFFEAAHKAVGASLLAIAV
ncbi:hypothetical protein ACYZUD_33175 [Pseudomonas sp. XS1P51]